MWTLYFHFNHDWFVSKLKSWMIIKLIQKKACFDRMTGKEKSWRWLYGKTTTLIGWDPGFWWGNSSWGDKDGAAYEIQLSRDPYRCNTAERRNKTKSWRFTAEYNTERGGTFYPWVGIVLHHTNTDVAFFSSKSVKYGGGGGEREANWGEQAPHPRWGWNLINAAS